MTWVRCNELTGWEGINAIYAQLLLEWEIIVPPEELAGASTPQQEAQIRAHLLRKVGIGSLPSGTGYNRRPCSSLLPDVVNWRQVKSILDLAHPDIWHLLHVLLLAELLVEKPPPPIGRRSAAEFKEGLAELFRLSQQHIMSRVENTFFSTTPYLTQACYHRVL
jgi:hypothetical protein